MRPLIALLIVLTSVSAFAQTPPAAPGDDAPTAAATAPVPAVDNPVIFIVNGDEIRAGEVRLAMQSIVQRLVQQGIPPEQEKVENAALAQTIDMYLLVQEAGRRELTVDPTTVNGILEGIIAQNGGRDQLAGSLAEAGVELEDVRRNIHGSELVRKLVEDEIKPTITVSDEDVSTFYAENPDQFKTPEEVHARHILRKVEAEAGDEDKAAARAAAEAARTRALAGEDFAELARELSEGPSGPNGGDLGFFTADRMVPPFSEAAFALQPGQISEVVETQFGYHVIKVEARKDASTMALEDIRDRLHAALVERKIGANMEEILNGLRQSADIKPVGEPEGEEGSTDATAETDAG